MDQALIDKFMAFTSSSAERAQQYLQVCDGQMDQAVDLFFSTGGTDLGIPAAGASAPPPVPTSTRPRPAATANEPIDLDDDGDEAMIPTLNDSDDEPQITGVRAREGAGASAGQGPSRLAPTEEDDEAMARRLQEEMYGAVGSARSPPNVDADGYRAPIARTRETLVGPGEGYDPADAAEMQAMIRDQMRRREMARQQRAGAPGIFNQQSTASPSIWDRSAAAQNDNDDDEDDDIEVDAANYPAAHYPASLRPAASRREALAQATGGASQASAKSTMLAEMYRPPFELMSQYRTWDEARAAGREGLKWLLVNIQDPSVFDCQLLNRDVWKHEGVRETVREHFLFLQYAKDDPRGATYRQYYFPDADDPDRYPHVAIVDPRTGEQVKRWSGRPAPKPADFLMQLHEFLDRYSLDPSAKNPVARRKPEPPRPAQVERMTEEQQLEMAMRASLEGSKAVEAENTGEGRAHDPDDLTRSVGGLGGAGRASAAASDDSRPAASDDTAGEAAPSSQSSGAPSPFALISASNTHDEPAAGAPDTTRIQFKLPSGRRVVRRFALADPVRRLFEWIKADPGAVGVADGEAAGEFELVSMGRKLIERLEESVADAGLRNGTVMVEFVES